MDESLKKILQTIQLFLDNKDYSDEYKIKLIKNLFEKYSLLWK